MILTTYDRMKQLFGGPKIFGFEIGKFTGQSPIPIAILVPHNQAEVLVNDPCQSGEMGPIDGVKEKPVSQRTRADTSQKPRKRKRLVSKVKLFAAKALRLRF